MKIGNLELSIFACGLDYCIPSSGTKPGVIYSEFEVLFAQIKRLQPFSSTYVESGWILS